METRETWGLYSRDSKNQGGLAALHLPIRTCDDLAASIGLNRHSNRTHDVPILSGFKGQLSSATGAWGVPEDIGHVGGGRRRGGGRGKRQGGRSALQGGHVSALRCQPQVHGQAAPQRRCMPPRRLPNAIACTTWRV